MEFLRVIPECKHATDYEIKYKNKQRTRVSKMKKIKYTNIEINYNSEVNRFMVISVTEVL